MKSLNLVRVVMGEEYPYVYEIKTSSGVSQFRVHGKIERYRVRDWGGEKEQTKLLIKKLVRNDIIYDIGASVGLVSILSAKMLENGYVYAFEPDTEIAERLKINIKLNHLRNVKVYQLVVGSKTGYAWLFTSGADDNSPSIRKTFNSNKKIKVRMLTVDGLIKRGLKFPTVIKIDVEGAEVQVLRGMKNTLKNKQLRMIYVEYHSEFLKKFDDSADLGKRIILKSGFKEIYSNGVHNQEIVIYQR